MRRLPVFAAAALTALVAATPAAALEHRRVARAGCDNVNTVRSLTRVGDRLGPLSWLASWDGYAEWGNMEALRDPRDGTNYAKNPMYLRRGAVASLAIARAYRDKADFVYGRGPNGSAVLSEVVRLSSCRNGMAFFAGGLVVTGPTCVLIEARQRGSRRVHRRMVSINMGANCPAP
jgi:hypothetical protein